MLDIQKIRSDFPILSTTVCGKPLVYLDNGATAQKPNVVIDTINRLHTRQNANIHRGVHYLSEACTEEYENARRSVVTFINANSTREIVFTAGTTAAINLVASSFGDEFVQEGNEIIVTIMEHHSNFVPWQALCRRKNARLRVVDLTGDGDLDLEQFQEFIGEKTRLITVAQTSNVLGTVNPVSDIIKLAHSYNIPVLVDGAQSVVHSKIDMQALDCDFFTFSGHKFYGPTGIGVLYAKEKWLDVMPPYQYGGDMVATVTVEDTTFADLPLKFEAGTANYIGAIGLGAAIGYLEGLGMENIQQYEQELLQLAHKLADETAGMTVYGRTKRKAGILSFLLDGIHHYDTGMILDKMGIAVRTGHLCAEPLMTYMGVTGLVRASFGLYNTKEEVQALFDGIKKVQQMLG
ncbi:MAG: cysteine desulfurase [Prevotellaceae bacterium]|jgi:cysteine desulfurase/selenocysteine lyase|nr:cysteine desulfurase [Prevotellaceae bacterium]